MTVLALQAFLPLFLLVEFISSQSDCLWCSLLPTDTVYPLYAQPVANLQQQPQHFEYSYMGYEPRNPNYFSFVFEDNYPAAPEPSHHPPHPAPLERQPNIDDSSEASLNNRDSAHSNHEPATHLDYFMNLDHYDIHLPEVPADSSWEPIDDFFLSVLDRYTRFWKRYRNGTELEEPTEEEVEADNDVEKSDKILKSIDEKFKTIDRLFEENQPPKLKLVETINGLEKVISNPIS